ncbi:fasciclin domain-containing protein [Nakamurella sp. UYEF19]|uniref:fasciclin domain-containing protein n=1 Tax=Nakamurella sp. UYEF19 TaxID=1756392 RepID=UPI0033920BFE
MSSGAMTSGAMTSGAMTSGAMTSGAMTSGAMTSGGATTSGASALVGSGCAAYAKAVPAGAGSVGGMALDPVATAASNNPLLKTLVAAVSGKVNPKVNLVNTLNSGEFTVFAPVDTAFAKVPAATIKTLSTDSALLTKILTYHVISGQLDATQIVGTHKTVEGGSVTVTGSGDNLKINGTTSVICGNVKTKNATVYLIDTVLTPPAS